MKWERDGRTMGEGGGRRGVGIDDLLAGFGFRLGPGQGLGHAAEAQGTPKPATSRPFAPARSHDHTTYPSKPAHLVNAISYNTIGLMAHHVEATERPALRECPVPAAQFTI